jgi:threonine/homoserine/homoserine lactone efflux protein
MGHVAAFVGIAALVIVTPGQDTALTIRNTLLAGRRGGVRTALGVASGNAVWTLAASAGIAAIVAASEPAFLALRIAGAAYLVFLGAQTLVGALRGSTSRHAVARGRPSPYRQGLLSNLGNAKVAVFFTSLLPQFASSFAPLLALGLLFSAMTLVWLLCYALVVARATDVLRRPRIRRALDAVTGTVLVALGIRVAAEHG